LRKQLHGKGLPHHKTRNRVKARNKMTFLLAGTPVWLSKGLGQPRRD
jgi:hypothetical protein